MSQYKKLIIFAFVGIISVWLGFFCFNEDQLIDIYRKSAYYFVTVAIILFLLAFFKEFNDINRIKALLKKHGLPLLLAFVVMSLGFIVCKPDYRILADETNLISDSQFLYDYKEPIIGISLLDFGNGIKDIIKTNIDKRPAFFPYMLNICHVLTGYRAENAFVMNYIFSSLALFFLYYLLQYKFGYSWGLCSMLIMAAFPLYIQYSASAGFEIFNLLCLFIFFLISYKFIKNPNAQWAEILILWLPLLGQSRYESASAVFVALPLILYALPKSEYIKLSYKSVIMPLLFLPVAWIHILTNNAASWQVESIDSGFSINNIISNLYNALEFFFVPNNDYNTIPVLAFMAIFYLLSRCVKKEKNHNYLKNPLFYVILLVYILHSSVRFMYVWFDLRSVIVSRLGIIFIPLIVMGATGFLLKIFEYFKLKKSIAYIFVIGLLFVYWPNAAANYGVKNQALFWEFNYSRNFLNNYFPNKREYVVISGRPNLYIPLGYSSVGFSEFNQEKDRILSHYMNRYFQYFIVIQQIDNQTNMPTNMDKLDGFRLQTLYEAQPREGYTYRISKGRPVFTPKEAIKDEKL